MTTHPSSLVIDGLAAGLVVDAEASKHIGGCARCRGDLEAAQAACVTFTRQVLPRTVGKLRPRPRWQLWPALLVPALAAALLVVWFVRDPDNSETPGTHEDIIRRKGALSFQVFANRGTEVIAVRDATRLAPGDRIRFVVGSGGPAYLLVASIDGAGTATIYYPYAGMQSGPATVEPSEVPGSIALDAAPGPERIFALVSMQPLDAAVVTRALRAIRGADAIRRTHTLDVPVTEQSSIYFDKAVP